MTEDSIIKYLINPDVVLREDDPDGGGLLFNPDTNQAKVINATGLSIYRQCSEIRTMSEIIAEVQKGFDNPHLDQLSKDVCAFINDLVTNGYIGIVDTAA